MPNPIPRRKPRVFTVIVIAGGTGRLGRILVALMAARGEQVRVLSRAPERSGARTALPSVEVVTADVRDRAAVDRAFAGARVVISALSAFGMKGVAPRDVDFEGNARLMAAAEKHGVDRFIFVSVLGASREHSMELARMKYLAEERLIQSNLKWAILRPSTFTETFQDILCTPLIEKGKTVVFGRAENPINFISAHDVARFVELAAFDPAMVHTITELGGSENLSLLQFVEAFSSATGVTGSVKHIPRLALRLLSRLARPFDPTFARMSAAALLMDTTNMSFDATELERRYPQIPLTTVAAVARRDYGARAARLAVAA
jgi:uncharacterized protein YbjT (DUF2867 family)